MRSIGRVAALFVVLLSSADCASSGAFWAGVANGLAASAPTSVGSGVPGFPVSPELLLFGGEGHKTFLGCLNCSKFNADSVMNEFGSHGNKFSADSLFNQFSQFGSKFSSYSACNALASDPPVIVDREGNYYGRLSLNVYMQTRSAGVNAWIAGVCAGR